MKRSPKSSVNSSASDCNPPSHPSQSLIPFSTALALMRACAEHLAIVERNAHDAGQDGDFSRITFPDPHCPGRKFTLEYEPSKPPRLILSLDDTDDEDQILSPIKQALIDNINEYAHPKCPPSQSTPVTPYEGSLLQHPEGNSWLQTLPTSRGGWLLGLRASNGSWTRIEL